MLEQLPIRLEFRSNGSRLNMAQSLTGDTGAVRVGLYTINGQPPGHEHLTKVAATASDIKNGTAGRDLPRENVSQGTGNFRAGKCRGFGVATTFL